MILKRNPLTLGCKRRGVAFVTVGLSRSAFVQRLFVSVGRGSRQSTSLRPQGAKAPEEPLTACRVGGWSIKISVVVLCSTVMFSSLESLSRLERRSFACNSSAFGCLRDRPGLWRRLSFLLCFSVLSFLSSRYLSLVRLVVLLCALVHSPEDGFIRVVRFACRVNLCVYLVLPSRFSECCVSYLSEGPCVLTALCPLFVLPNYLATSKALTS